MKITILTLAAMLFSACSSNYIRVTEYDAGTSSVPFVGGAGAGCMWSFDLSQDIPPGTFTYTGETCALEITIEK